MIIQTLKFKQQRIVIALMPNDHYSLSVNGVVRATNRSVEPLYMLADEIYADLEFEHDMDEQQARYEASVQANYAARGYHNIY